jgi:hypothetical protein
LRLFALKPTTPTQNQKEKADVNTALKDVLKLEDAIPPGPNAPPLTGYKSKLKPHPIACVFPMASQEEILELSTSILKNGQHDDIVLFEGMILDGRNRDAACVIAGVEPKLTEFDPEKDGSAVQYVWDKNFHRRQLTPGQKAVAAVEMIPFFEAEAAKHQPAVSETTVDTSESQAPARKGGRKGSGGKSAAKAAKATGASRSNVERAKKLKRKNPKGYERVKKGQSTLNKELEAEQLENAYKRIEEICGPALAKAARSGARFRNKAEVLRFAKLPKDKMEDIRGLIETANWKVADAINYKSKDLNPTHKIGDLLARTAKEGGNYKCEVEGFVIECRRAKNADAKPAVKKAAKKKAPAKAK